MLNPNKLIHYNIKSRIFEYIHKILGISYYAKEIYADICTPSNVMKDHSIMRYNFIINYHTYDKHSLHYLISDCLRFQSRSAVDMKFVVCFDQYLTDNLTTEYEHWVIDYNSKAVILVRVNDREYVVYFRPFLSENDITEDYVNLHTTFTKLVNHESVKIIATQEEPFRYHNYCVAITDSLFIELAWELEDYGVSHTEFLEMFKDFITLFAMDYFEPTEAVQLLEKLGEQETYIDLLQLLKKVKRTINSLKAIDVNEKNEELAEDKKELVVELLRSSLDE